MKITALCGFSGTGKTHKRLNDSVLAALPFIDIADIYDELEADDTGLVQADYYTAMEILIDRIVAAKNEEVPHLVIEGYFLPKTPSRTWLSNAMRIQGIEIIWDLLWAPLDVCAARLADQWWSLTDGERGNPAIRHKFTKRTDLLVKCWRPQ